MSDPNSNGNGNGDTRLFAMLDKLPLWFKFLLIIGFPTVVAVFFMAKDVGLIGTESANATAHYDESKHHTRLLRAMCYRLPENPKAPPCEP